MIVISGWDVVLSAVTQVQPSLGLSKACKQPITVLPVSCLIMFNISISFVAVDTWVVLTARVSPAFS
jgi:hypothetical protein